MASNVIKNGVYAKNDIINYISERYTITTCKLETIVNVIVSSFKNEIKVNKSISIINLGKFYLKYYKTKSGRCFKTGELRNNERLKVTVRCSFKKRFKEALNNNNLEFSELNYSTAISNNVFNALNEMGLTIKRKDSVLLVNTFFEGIVKALFNHKRVYVNGFGIFQVRQYKEKKMKDNINKTNFIVSAKNSPFFKCSKNFFI